MKKSVQGNIPLFFTEKKYDSEFFFRKYNHFCQNVVNKKYCKFKNNLFFRKPSCLRWHNGVKIYHATNTYRTAKH